MRTWENARAANAFSRTVKKQLADPAKSWHLEQIDNNNWKLYTVNPADGNKRFYQAIQRVSGY